jgi:hypothetical protein
MMRKSGAKQGGINDNPNLMNAGVHEHPGQYCASQLA